jgi:hypothetical protein
MVFLLSHSLSHSIFLPQISADFFWLGDDWLVGWVVGYFGGSWWNGFSPLSHSFSLIRIFSIGNSIFCSADSAAIFLLRVIGW